MKDIQAFLNSLNNDTQISTYVNEKGTYQRLYISMDSMPSHIVIYIDPSTNTVIDPFLK